MARKRDELTVVGRAAKYKNEGVEVEMIADRMNVTPGTVHGYISRAKHRSLVNTPEIKVAADVKDKELRELQDRILAAEPGTNVVYFEHPDGWSKAPKNLREMITSMANSGLIVHLMKRNNRGSFSLIVQRTKR